MDIERALPRPELRSVVRSFEERRADLGSTELTWPVAARPHQILISIWLSHFRFVSTAAPQHPRRKRLWSDRRPIAVPMSVCQAKFMFSTFCFNRLA